MSNSEPTSAAGTEPAPQPGAGLRISEAALKLQVPRHYIDYWRKTGLLPAAGLLAFQDLLKIRFLAACRRQGISLQQMRRQIREFESESIADWYNQLTPYEPLAGVLLSRSDGQLAHPETGQIFFSYDEGPSDAPGAAGGHASVVNLTERRSAGHADGGEARNGLWSDSRGDPQLLDLESEYLNVVATGDFRRISRVLEQMVKIQPDHVAALIEFGNLCYEHERLEDALRYYERAVEIQADCVEALYNLANIHFKAKRYAVAIRYFQRCMDLDPEFPEAYYNLGLLYYSLRYYERAIESLSAYCVLDPDSVWSEQARQLIEDMEGRQESSQNRHPGLFDA